MTDLDLTFHTPDIVRIERMSDGHIWISVDETHLNLTAKGEILVNTIGLAAESETPIKLWLDDVRDPAQYGHVGWTWARTYDKAIELLRTGRVIRASLDHDLTIEQAIGQPDGQPTGYDVLVWMRDNNAWPPEGVQVHSVNPDGRRRMEEFIRRYQPIRQESK